MALQAETQGQVICSHLHETPLLAGAALGMTFQQDGWWARISFSLQ